MRVWYGVKVCEGPESGEQRVGARKEESSSEATTQGSIKRTTNDMLKRGAVQYSAWLSVPIWSSTQPRSCLRCFHATSARQQAQDSSQQETKAEKDDGLPQFGPPEAYISTSHSPLFNLSFEEHLLRTRPHNTPVCFIYRNDPCIVIGRNQNHWKELNIDEMRRRNLSLVRRRSGGGAVFHVSESSSVDDDDSVVALTGSSLSYLVHQDLGNTNFSFHVPRLTFARRTHAELIARALNGPSVGLRTLTWPSEACPPARDYSQGQGSPEGVYVNDRNDLVVRVSAPGSSGSMDWAERKVSGSAFKILTHRAYHHGTTLLNADLSALGSSLRNSKSSRMISKGVESVKSGVVNLSAAYPAIAQQGLLEHDRFTRAVVDEFWRTYSQIGRDDEDSEKMQVASRFETVDEDHALAHEEARVRLQSEIGKWDWIFGQCPEFETEFDASDASQDVQRRLSDVGLEDAKVWLRCKNGIIEEAHVESSEHWEEIIMTGLRGKRYDAFTDSPPLPPSADVEMVNGDIECDDEKVKEAVLMWFREAM